MRQGPRYRSWLLAIVGLSCLLLAAGCRGGAERETAGKALVREAPVVAWGDGDRDGIPDGAELVSANDRQNLRRWMAGIAEWQYYQLSESWNERQRDCAGLVRFALREALRRHDRAWYQSMNRGLPPGGEYEVFAPDVARFTLDRHPLGERLFRVSAGTFEFGDQSAGRFSEFADARSLRSYNTVFLDRQAERAQPGDLLFFHQPWVQRYPYHVMVFLGRARRDAEGADDWVVYHTGDGSPGRPGEDSGAMKKVRLAMLRRHPDARWHPVAANRHFLGFHRLKMLD
jgi:uncharacterized protein